MNVSSGDPEPSLETILSDVLHLADEPETANTNHQSTTGTDESIPVVIRMLGECSNLKASPSSQTTDPPPVENSRSIVRAADSTVCEKEYVSSHCPQLRLNIVNDRSDAGFLLRNVNVTDKDDSEFRITLKLRGKCPRYRRILNKVEESMLDTLLEYEAPRLDVHHGLSGHPRLVQASE